VNLTFDERSHTYRVDGQVVPSVTQILEHAQFVDPTGFTEVSRSRGALVHRSVELYDLGRMPRNPGVPEVQGYLEAYIRFKEESGFVDRESEVRLGSALYRFAGTLDKVGAFHLPGSQAGIEAIVDIKTGEPARWWGMQLAGYQILDQERTRGSIWRRRFDLQLHEDATYNLVEQRSPADRGVFLAALTCWHWLNDV